MNYPDSVQFLYALGNEIKSAKLGLERIRAVLEALGNPERAFRVVHVAGTNGKGSTCAMIEAGLRAAGVRTGLFTSPHLIEPTERIQIDGIPVSPADFERAFNVVHETAEKLDLDCHPTYFESVTAMAFWLFREKRVHTAVIEVGLGGRLDSTNVVEPVLTVITPDRFRSRGVPGPHHRSHRERESRDPEARNTGGLRAAASGSVSRAFGASRGAACARHTCRGFRDPRSAHRRARLAILGDQSARSRASTRWITPSLPRWLCALWESPRTGSPKPAGPDASSTFLRIPTLSSMARTIRPERAPWRATSNGSMAAAGSGWSMARCATKPSRRSRGSCSPSRRELVLTAPDTSRALRPEALAEFAGRGHIEPNVEAAIEYARTRAARRRRHRDHGFAVPGGRSAKIISRSHRRTLAIMSAGHGNNR